MLPSDGLQHCTQPQSTTNAESAPDAEAEKKKLHNEPVNSALTSMEPQNSSEEYMASYSRSKDDNISSCTRKRMDEKKKMVKREKIQKILNQKLKELKEREKEKYETEEKDDIGGEFSLFPCCKEIDNPEELFEHIKKHHDKDATQCALCGKELSSKSSLDRHLLIHAKWQPYQCSHCNKQFSTNGNMHRHKKTHRGTHKGSKLSKGDVAPTEEITPAKNIKRDLMQSKEEEEEDLFLNPKFGFFFNKRKMRERIYGHNIAKKTKLDSSSEIVENSEQTEQNKSMQSFRPNKDVCIHRTGIDLRIPEQRIYNAKISALSPKRPSKQEFIATLGLRNVCKLEQIQPPVMDCRPNSNDESLDVRSLTERYPNLKKVSPDLKEKEFFPETKNEEMAMEKEIDDEVNDKELVIDFRKEQEDLADITSILSNMKSQRKVVAPLNVKEESKLEPKSCNNSINNHDSYLSSKSKETGTCINSSAGKSDPLSFFVPKEEPQQQHKFVCSQCQENFENQHSLQRHLLTHGKPKSFKCMVAECNAKFLNKPNAIRHCVKVHKMKRSGAKTMIDYNLESTPSSGTKTVCEWCGKDFTSNLILEHHKRALTGCRKKPFLCLLCNKTFSTKNNGRRHQAQYHKDYVGNRIVPNNAVNRNAVELNQPSTSSPISTASNLSLTSSPISTASNQSSTSSPISTASNLSSTSSPILTVTNQFSNSSPISIASNQSSTSSPISTATETSNNGFEKNDSSSNCSDSNLFESSLPSKELAAAQVLLNLSMHTSKNDSIEQHENNEDNMHTYTPVVLSNICSFSSRNDVTLQDCPLDLSLRPMDLRKSFEKEFPTRKCVSDGFLNFHNIYMSPRKEWEPMSPLAREERDNVYPTEAPLNLVKRDDFVMDVRPSTSQSSLTESKPHEEFHFSPLQDLPKNRSQNSSSGEDTKLQCDFCSISFANNSNKRRHEKKKHQLHGPDSTPVHPSQECPEPKKSKSVLSEKTKEALITKVSLKPTAGVVDYSANGSCSLNHPVLSLSSETESGDLASVSSLINTANSPQLKKYLTTDSNCDVMLNQETTSDKNEVDVAPKPTCQKLDGKKAADKHWCHACNKEFTCKSSFNRHLVIHTKERNFHCSECNKTFTVKSNRDRHLKKIHKITFTHVGRRSLMRRPQKKSDTEVPSEEEAMDLDVKDLTLPKELLQCNKENRRLFMPS